MSQNLTKPGWKSISEKHLISRINDLEKSNLLTFSSERAMITVWMLAMAFGAAGLIWYGLINWELPEISITALGLGIFLILASINRIVREEIKRGKTPREEEN